MENGREILVPTTDRIKAKSENLAPDFLGREKVARVTDLVLNLDKADNIGVLTQVLGKAANKG